MGGGREGEGGGRGGREGGRGGEGEGGKKRERGGRERGGEGERGEGERGGGEERGREGEGGRGGGSEREITPYIIHIQVLLYDLRSPRPYLVKDHLYSSPIHTISFQSSEGLVLSADSKILKIWNEKDASC